MNKADRARITSNVASLIERTELEVHSTDNMILCQRKYGHDGYIVWCRPKTNPTDLPPPNSIQEMLARHEKILWEFELAGEAAEKFMELCYPTTTK